MPTIYRIHPAIGIARVGNSLDEYFIGPEAPGVAPSLTQPGVTSSKRGTYRDRQQRIKRQGARFRVYEYTVDAAGATTNVREITAATAHIEWEVHLVNRKAAEVKRFFSVPGRTDRNKGVDRNLLVIDPGAQRISGANQPMKRLDGMFMRTVPVTLGDLLTDNDGRLIVLGGHGTSQSHDGKPLSNADDDFADNDGWCDDTADGPVTATIVVNGSREQVAADPAWVIVGPPDFAPALENVVTLYDRVYDVMAAFDPSLAVTAATRVSFTRDIYPILRRVSNMHWASDFAMRGHGKDSRGHFISQLDTLARNEPKTGSRREVIFRRLQNPAGGGFGDMPNLATDRSVPGVSLTQVQYDVMRRWAEGAFEADWKGAAPTALPLEKLPERERPHALDRAALDAGVGGPFFPGIEVGRIVLDQSTYDRRRPFRINTARIPGELTARMAVPWQADFFACECDNDVTMDWWPGQRPDHVFRGPNRAQWRLGVSSMHDMVDKWSQLGFVVEKKSGQSVRYVEAERSLKSGTQPAGQTT